MIIPLRPVLDHYGVTYRDSDNWTKILCPVHGETVPSCSLNLGTNYLECHACPFKGHTLDLIMAKESLNREAAVAFAQTILGDGYQEVRSSAGWRTGGRVPRGEGYKPKLRGGFQNRVRR